MVASMVAGAPAAQGASTPPTGEPVRAPHYGDVLFHFFQERWFPAVTGLMASQHFERLSPHDDDAELLRGGLLLSYGQHDEAAQIFERLAATRPKQRDRAWLMLARARYERARFADAEGALARIEQQLPGELEDERSLLAAQLLLARGEAAAAAQVLQAAAARPPAKDPRQVQPAAPFARFNRAIALLQAGDEAGGRSELDALGREVAGHEELRALRDRANLALGTAALRGDEPQLARAALSRVRLHAAPSNAALLAFGWAAMQQGRVRDALVPWLELAGRDRADPAVQEARIAVPYAYAELGATREAAGRYESALGDFEAEARALDAARAALRDGSALAPLLAEGEDEARELGAAPRVALPGGLPHAAQLAPVLAEHAFQQAFVRWRDLRWLHGNLDRWAASLVAFDDIRRHRQQAYADRLVPALAAARAQAAGAEALAARHRALAAETAAAEAAADGVALASDAELALLRRIASVREGLAAAQDDDEVPLLAERLRRVAGVLGWQLAQARPARAWEAAKSLRAIETALAQARDREAALAQAQRDEPERFARLAARIESLARRIAALQPQVLALADEQRAALAGIAVAVLDRAGERLAGYAAQARFALAQLQDRAEPAPQAALLPGPRPTPAAEVRDARR